jgi:hypothetical protein
MFGIPAESPDAAARFGIGVCTAGHATWGPAVHSSSDLQNVTSSSERQRVTNEGQFAEFPPESSSSVARQEKLGTVEFSKPKTRARGSVGGTRDKTLTSILFWPF